MIPPDILFIVLDTQRADRLGCYGYPDIITPNLDCFADQAALFEQAISPAQWTIPSHASMFTGLYPTAHQVTQFERTLSPDVPHLAEVLSSAGYQTVGFSNNPVVGIFNNGLTRGFETFYNYGGASPNPLQRLHHLPWPLPFFARRYRVISRRISCFNFIHIFLTRSDLALRASLNPLFAPLFAKLGNIKGQNERSIGDICHFLEQREKIREKRPLFLFANLMETHMPLWPPREFVDKVPATIGSGKRARTIMHRWNRECYRWDRPLDEPLGKLERSVLSNMYNAEVAYQDDYLGRFFAILAGRRNRDDTLTIITSDHGEGLGEHNCTGHGFVAYQELVHVPLIMHWPAQIAAGRVNGPVSTRRIFHTILDAANDLSDTVAGLAPERIRVLSLQETLGGHDPEDNTAYAEAYPRLRQLKVLERVQSELIASFRCFSLRRAIVRDNLKMIQIDNVPEELYDLEMDPFELNNIVSQKPIVTDNLNQKLNRMISQVKLQRDKLAAGPELNLEDDEHLMTRLRHLGYLE